MNSSIYQRKGRPVWYVSYFCTKAIRRVHVATPWRVDDPTGRKHALRFARLKEQDAAAMRGNAKHETWNAWVPGFLSDRYRRSPLTLSRYMNAWDWLCVFLDKEGVLLPSALSYNHAIRYVPWRTGQKRHCGKLISRNTAITELKLMGLIMREAIRRGFATINACEKLGIIRDPPKEKPELKDSEIAAIRAECHRREAHLPIADQWLTTSFEIALHSLCRLSSTSIPMSCVDLEAGTLTLRVKGRKVGEPAYLTVPMHPALRPRLEALRDAGASHTCILPRMAAKEWWELRKHLGLSHTCFHSTRVTGITRLWRGGVPESIAMRLAGHRSTVVHRIYQRARTEDLAKHLAGLHFGAIAGTPQTPGARPTKPE